MFGRLELYIFNKELSNSYTKFNRFVTHLFGHIMIEHFSPPGLVHHRPTSMLQWRCASRSVGSCPGANLLGCRGCQTWSECCAPTYSDSKIWHHCLHSWIHLFCECKIVFPFFQAAETLHNFVEGASVGISIMHDLHQLDCATPASDVNSSWFSTSLYH